MEPYFVLKFLHVIGACVLLGTGAGIAFFMLIAHRTADVPSIAAVSRIVVIADFVFTATSAIAQPITGLLLTYVVGYDLREGWIVASIALYLVIGAFWLPVVWIQMQMAKLADTARQTGTSLPDRYHRLYRIWFWFGWPAFVSMLLIIWLMIARPSLTLS
jgi:uncharacterized membrane protein